MPSLAAEVGTPTKGTGLEATSCPSSTCNQIFIVSIQEPSFATPKSVICLATMNIKQESTPEHQLSDHNNEMASSSVSPSSSVSGGQYTVTNENWRGKNDPTERRRIQNRINQRAFRQRQRAGEIPKQYRKSNKSAKQQSQADLGSGGEGSNRRQTSSGPESCTSQDNYEDENYDFEGSDDGGDGLLQGNDDLAATSPRVFDSTTGLVWDELARLINSNFRDAVQTNAQFLGINSSALNNGAAMAITMPRPAANAAIPTSLWPVEVQHRLPHDPYISAIPHPQLRVNILTAIFRGQIDAAAFSLALRASGSLERFEGGWQRGGLIVWGTSPATLSNWEVSEAFFRKWQFLLNGCQDLVASTNVWRTTRGETPFVV